MRAAFWMVWWLIMAIVIHHARGQDLSGRVKIGLLSQTEPITVTVSMNSWTTVQVPQQIQTLEGGAFTQKPEEETGEFCIVPGVNWFTVKSLKEGAKQNLGIVIAGRVYEIVIQTADENDFSVILEFPK